ncbi:Mth938-like domain-containing protein [Sinisalibacter aestuarii]|uniref:Membrane protein n=1 Tax=Sinisalibacter aestuarii TaxID=2949426 RepID=A0ABQ5LS66_9RHOB|nr:Mth938-like domain-containing protein [Sinisalibacter aestuarii]GKY87840.1 membrane protein [Sinisalibacter aestuarii]
MQLVEITYDNAQPIDGYGPGFFRVGGQVIEGAVIVTASAARGWHGIDDAGALTALAGQVDVILFGSGAEMTGAPAALVRAVEAAGIGLEPMASPSACRAYNVLLAEGRRVALAALPV